MSQRWLVAFLYALHLIWTGLQAGITASAYKANALWFCLVLGVGMVAASYLFRSGRSRVAKGVSFFVIGLVFVFYLYCFIKHPAEDANLRVGLIILSSVAAGGVIFLPASRGAR